METPSWQMRICAGQAGGTQAQDSSSSSFANNQKKLQFGFFRIQTSSFPKALRATCPSCYSGAMSGCVEQKPSFIAASASPTFPFMGSRSGEQGNAVTSCANIPCEIHHEAGNIGFGKIKEERKPFSRKGKRWKGICNCRWHQRTLLWGLSHGV